MGTYLTSKLNKFSLKYPNFNYDLEKEVVLQRVSLQIVKLQHNSGLDLEGFAKKISMQTSNLSRLQSGVHNPTILSLLDIAFHCDYDIQLIMREKNKL